MGGASPPPPPTHSPPIPLQYQWEFTCSIYKGLCWKLESTKNSSTANITLQKLQNLHNPKSAELPANNCRMKGGKAIVSILFAFALVSSGCLFELTVAAISESSLEGATLEGLTYITKLSGAEASQAANYLYTFLQRSGHGDGNYVRCFTTERSAEEGSEIDYMARLVEDYRSALGYSHYLEGVKEHFHECAGVDTPSSYCSSLNDLDSKVHIMTQSLANLVRFINETAYHNVTLSSAMQTNSDQSPDEDKGGVAEGGDTSDVDCTSPCPSQQAVIYVYLQGFALDYVSADIDGYLKHRK